MKEYIIVRCGHIAAFNIERVTRQETGIVYGQEQPAVSQYQNMDSYVYFADTLPDANNLAQRLTTLNQGVTYLVGKTTDVFYRPPSNVIHSKFTEKGLLPV
jgi:hypothetical protein